MAKPDIRFLRIYTTRILFVMHRVVLVVIVAKDKMTLSNAVHRKLLVILTTVHTKVLQNNVLPFILMTKLIKIQFI